MAESVLQSFVIRLTYAVDEVSSRKFQQGIQQGIQGLNGVRVAALAAVVGIEEMVRRTTNAYAPLDYLAKSSGTSAAAIDHLSALFIGANMSAQQAQATIGQLGQEFRIPPRSYAECGSSRRRIWRRHHRIYGEGAGQAR